METVDIAVCVDFDLQTIEYPPPVTIEPTVYTLIKGDGLMILLPIGTISLGTLADPMQALFIKGKTYNVIPIKQVTYTGSARPIVAFARCA